MRTLQPHKGCVAGTTRKPACVLGETPACSWSNVTPRTRHCNCISDVSHTHTLDMKPLVWHQRVSFMKPRMYCIVLHCVASPFWSHATPRTAHADPHVTSANLPHEATHVLQCHAVRCSVLRLPHQATQHHVQHKTSVCHERVCLMKPRTHCMYMTTRVCREQVSLMKPNSTTCHNMQLSEALSKAQASTAHTAKRRKAFWNHSVVTHTIISINMYILDWLFHTWLQYDCLLWLLEHLSSCSHNTLDPVACNTAHPHTRCLQYGTPTTTPKPCGYKQTTWRGLCFNLSCATCGRAHSKPKIIKHTTTLCGHDNTTHTFCKSL